MAFVTSKRWLCNTCGKGVDATDQPPDGWLHVKWWRTDGQVYEIDICSGRCALSAEKVLTKTLAMAHKPTETI
jgi:hypothetical protein